MRTGRALASAAGLVAGLTLLSRVFGLVRKLAQSWALSDSPIATAYDTANTVPNVLFEVAAGGALAGAVIPILSRFLKVGDKRLAAQAAGALMTWILSVGMALALVVSVAASPIISVLLADAAPEMRNLAALLLRIFAAQIPLYGLSVVATGILHSHGHFFWPALSPLLSSVSVSAMFLWYSTWVEPFADPAALTLAEVALLGGGTTLGVVLFAIPQLLIASRFVRLRPTFTFPPGVGALTLRLGAAGLATLAAQQVAIIAIMIVANSAGDVGTYAAFNYAYAIFMVPYAVLAVPIATVTFPRISAATGQARTHVVAQSTRLVLAMGMVSAALLIVLASPAKIVLEVGRDIAGLEAAMQAMAIGSVGMSLLYHGVRVLYGCGQARRVIAANSFGWGTVVGGLVVSTLLGISGRISTLMAVGISISVGLSVGAVAVLVMMFRSLGPQSVAGIVRTGVTLLPVLVAAGLAARFLVGWILDAGGSTILAAIGAAVVGGVVVIGAAGAALYAADRQAFASLSR
ncbi:murein biosynthesis integral membrane protein MurJ [Trueperella pyogenes]|uniref:Virulence factor MviN n=1 Tax=Trueperella pyogenes TaxID=1661 RepID=A0A3S9QJG0_9ACTO|nr:virulence factor MviN [Trueperella pyogenes]AWG15399.1 virulence factor MviN [Trueperella pyogenes]AZR04286.1 virulence factor MviN [Trueperella pyogenes]AZR06147.1 virulence factor MviN [Trueperella pyogenes]